MNDQALVEAPEAPDHFERADTLLRALRYHRDRREHLREWTAGVVQKVDERIQQVEEELEHLGRVLREQSGLKTISLPEGTLQTRKTSPTTQKDPELWLEWIDHNRPGDEWWVTVKKPRVGDIMKTIEFQDTGVAVCKMSGELIAPEIISKVAPEHPVSVTINPTQNRGGER